MRVQQALKRKQEIIHQGKAKRQEDAAEIAKLKGELAGDAANSNAMQGTHTAFIAQETARQAKDTAQLTAAKAAASAQGSGATAAAAAAAVEPAAAETGEEAGEGEGVKPKPGCEPVPCKGEAGETVEANHKGAGEWKHGKIEALNGDGTCTVTYTDAATEKEDKVTMADMRAVEVDCGGSPSGIDEHAAADCDQTKCGAVCVAKCNEGYEGASVEYSCSGKDAAWVKTTEAGDAGADGGACKLLAPEVPYVTKVTAEDSSLKVSFAASPANEAKYIVSAVPQTGGTAITTEVASATGTSTEATVVGLTNGVEYLVAVKVTNSRGTEDAAAYSAVAPTDVKNKYSAVTGTKSAKEATISTKEQKLKRDWGPDMQYSQMDGKCIEKEASKFVYKICALEKVEQKDGGSWTNLGSWSGWDHAKNEMKFKQGTKCWNGPHRSATVVMVCGPEDEILTVAEPETCEYVLKMATPSVCTEADLPKLYGGAGAGAGAGKEDL